MCIDEISGSALAPMESYLLPDGHPLIARHTGAAFYSYLWSTAQLSAASFFVDGVHRPPAARQGDKDVAVAKWRSEFLKL